jgi:putative acetyltransferase
LFVSIIAATIFVRMEQDFTIQQVTTESKALDDARMLFTEYVNELNEDLAFQSLAVELQDPLKKYGAQKGSLHVVYKKGSPVACVALQALPQQGVCEMKRLYVQPAFRKDGIGDMLVKLIIGDAKERGYTLMVLDTLERLQPAISLYTKHGFTVTEAYYDNPLPGVVFMERRL